MASGQTKKGGLDGEKAAVRQLGVDLFGRPVILILAIGAILTFGAGLVVTG